MSVHLMAAACAFALCVGTPLPAQNAGCASSFAASANIYDKPFHVYIISRRSGLLLKSDVHQDVGGSLGKSHIVSRYEYANVRPPAGVQ